MTNEGWRKFYSVCRNPYDYCDDDEDEEDKIKPMKVNIDLGLSAYANARK